MLCFFERMEEIGMKIAVFHGSPRKGNTYHATRLFMDALAQKTQAEWTEFFLPQALPDFCAGCQRCLGGPRGQCPHAAFVDPIYRAILEADALLLTTPHYGASSMSSCMKNLLDHLDFLTLNVAPREALFGKKAFVLTTGAGSAAAIRPIARCLQNWGVNRVSSLGIRMYTNAWDQMPPAKQAALEKRLGKAAVKFARLPLRRPYLSTVFMYHLSKWVLKKQVGEGAYPYEYWTKKGYFAKRPF